MNQHICTTLKSLFSFSVTSIVGLLMLGPTHVQPVLGEEVSAPFISPPPLYLVDGKTPCSPQPPIDVSLEPLDDLTPGEIVRFRLTVTPRVVPRETRVTCRFGEAVEWISGDTTFAVSGAIDVSDQSQFSVRVPRQGQHALHVVVEVVTEGGKIWRRGVGLGLGPNPHAEAARFVTDSHGRSMVQYPAAPATKIDGADR